MHKKNRKNRKAKVCGFLTPKKPHGWYNGR